MKKGIVLLLIGILCVGTLSGCKPIFQQKKDKYKQVELTKEDLENDTYYVKDGTRFIQVYAADTKETRNQDGTKQKVSFLTKDYKTVPTLYRSEILAIPSQKLDVANVELVRYKEVGYSLGFYGLQMDEDGYLVGKLKENVYKNSRAYSVIEDGKSNDFRIVSINDEPVSTAMLSDAGVFNCLEESGTYEVAYYAGTYYTTNTIPADTFTLEEYEYYTLSDTSDTKNGYISFKMPDDAVSGWYYIKGGGLFRYIAAEKGIDIATVDMNAPYYLSIEERQAAYSQKFSTTFEKRMRNVTISFDYEPASITEEELTGTLYSPDGTAYVMDIDKENNKMYCALEEAMAGKWYVYIQPKDAVITNMAVLSNQQEQEVTEEDFTITIEEGQINYGIMISYKGDGDIYAVLVNGDNELNDFALDDRKRQLYYNASYLSPGDYLVKVYHYTDTEIVDVTTQENTITDSDIITVTE